MRWGKWQWFGNIESLRCILLMLYYRDEASVWGLLTWLHLNCWWIMSRQGRSRVFSLYESFLSGSFHWLSVKSVNPLCFLTLLLSFDQSCMMLFLGQERSRIPTRTHAGGTAEPGLFPWQQCGGCRAPVGSCLPSKTEALRTLSREALPESGAVPPIRRRIKPNPLGSERDLSLGMNSDDRHPQPSPTG